MTNGGECRRRRQFEQVESLDQETMGLFVGQRREGNVGKARMGYDNQRPRVIEQPGLECRPNENVE